MESTADNLMMNAKCFARSANTLLQTRDDRHDLTILHLTALSVELTFKAWIKHSGGTEADLKKIGHHLDRAYEQSIKHGMLDRSGKLKRAIDIIAPIYGMDYTRYLPDIDGFVMLSASDLVQVATELARSVEICVWPDDHAEEPHQSKKPPPR